MPERNGRQIELIDLATHTSGLPGMPSDFYPVKDPANPYAHYTKEQMYRWVSGYRLDRDIGVKFQYSNLGGALLGQIVADRAGVDYETLVHDRITGPLRMRDTAISMTPGMKARLAVGHDDHMRPTSNWDLPAFEGAGGLRSTANDLLTFVGAELGYVDTPLRAAMRAQLRPRRPTANQRQCETLGWAINEAPMPEVIWHDGGTGGYESYMGFDPKTGVGVVVLTNAIGPNGGNDIGFHILMGRPIPSGS